MIKGQKFSFTSTHERPSVNSVYININVLNLKINIFCRFSKEPSHTGNVKRSH